MQLWNLLPVVDATLREDLLARIDTLRMMEEEMGRGSKRLALPKREQAIEALLVLLEGDDDELRTEAIRGLAAFGEPEAIPVLIPYLKSKNARVQEATRVALNNLAVMAGKAMEKKE